MYDPTPSRFGPRPMDVTGRRFGLLVCLELTSERRHRYGRSWKCRCDCGNETTAYITHLLKGSRVSCGCFVRNILPLINQKHGMGNSPEAVARRQMIDRCHNPRHKNWENYGGRGITVCQRWREGFEAFYEDMGPRPSSRHSLDRIDNDRDYEPGNCRWATSREQGANRRTTRLIEFEGEMLPIAEWARRLSVTHSVLRGRINRHGVEGAFGALRLLTPKLSQKDGTITPR